MTQFGRSPGSCISSSARFLLKAATVIIGTLCFADGMPEPVKAQSLDGSPRKQMVATRLNGSDLHFDGRLDDAEWQRAQWVSDFLQKEPVEGKVPDEQTEVAVLYDDHFLYIGARMHSNDVGKIGLELNRRDNPGNSEQMIVSIDTYHDMRTCYDFGVSAAGVRTDRYHGSDDEYDRDLSYNPVWDARTHVNSSGWTAEMRIPFSQLRFNRTNEQVWGINLNRWIPDRNEDNFWVYVPRNETGWSSYFGELIGIEGIAPSRRIELLPYAAGDGQFVSNSDDSDPFNGSSDLDSRFGTDLKMGLGPNITLDATVNPDFGQVEADPAEVNLSAYETFFDEKRPFFIEGSQLFENIGPTFFYSRRIGRQPQGDVPSLDDTTSERYSEVFHNSTILGAAKVTGRFGSGLSLGALTSLTSRERAHWRDIDNKSGETVERGVTEVEPVTGQAVLRLQQEFGEDQSTVGVLLTGLERDIKNGDPLATELHKRAYAGNGDWRLRFAGGKYQFYGHAGFSYVEGDTTVIQNTQQSSAHYFQRPDADYITYDPTRTSLTGWTGSLRLDKNAGKHWLWGGGIHAESPALELNDVGILGSADDIESWGNIRYRETTPGPVFRSYNSALYLNTGWNFGGVTQYRSMEWVNNATWKNWWSSEIFFGAETRALSDNATRGGPLMGGFQGWWGGAGTWSNFSKPTRYGIYVFTSQTEIYAWQYNLELEFTTRVGRRWSFTFEPEYWRSRGRRQYVDTFEDGSEATFGKRYVFSSIEQSRIAAEIRLNYFFSPDLSLEVYAEPFVASGRYFGFGELPAPRSRSIRTYGEPGTESTIEETEDGVYTVNDERSNSQFEIEQSDFGYLSFRSNVVLRWEFRRGSTLFLVWQQNREGDERPGDLVTFRSLRRTLSASGDNFLALKIAYWIPVS